MTRASHDVTKETIDQWMTELSNWGRWGADDQLGTLNLITPEKRKQALALVREGISVSMSHNYIKEEAPDAPRVFEHTMLGDAGREGLWASDRYSIAYHGYTHSHLDALCHMAIDGVMYNGFKRAEHVSESGFCGKLSILDVKQGIMTRGVLMDIPRLKGVDYLELGTKIYVEDLEAWERQAGVRVGPGDVIFVRSGRWARRAAVGPWDTSQQAAALHVSVAPWIKARDVAIVGSDHTSDALPSGVEGVREPVHQMMLVAMGVRLFDNLDLEAVAEEAARQKRWEFLLTAAPLAVEGGTGSPLNPIATF
jgi:kynurenine formamidase